jgi:hypothetical protein
LGAARIMIELSNKHTLSGKLCCFQIVLCAQLGGDFLSQSLTLLRDVAPGAGDLSQASATRAMRP